MQLMMVMVQSQQETHAIYDGDCSESIGVTCNL